MQHLFLKSEHSDSKVANVCINGVTIDPLVGAVAQQIQILILVESFMDVVQLITATCSLR